MSFNKQLLLNIQNTLKCHSKIDKASILNIISSISNDASLGSDIKYGFLDSALKSMSGKKTKEFKLAPRKYHKEPSPYNTLNLLKSIYDLQLQTEEDLYATTVNKLDGGLTM